ncbi:MAG: dihydropteroate synthase [Algisphaera sp.]
MSQRPFNLIGELINHSFARARRAWEAKDTSAYQHLAKIQETGGAGALTVNIDGTQSLRVKQEEMIAFLPDLVPALQEATSLPLAFDNPAIAYHAKALELYDFSKSARPIFNSISASRENLDEMFALIKQYDTDVIVMASEKLADGQSLPCENAQDVYESTLYFTQRLREEAGRTNDQIIVDPGLAPVASDTYGLINMGLDGMRMIRQDPILTGVHLSIGLTNFSFGVPKNIREGLENAYITLAMEAGLDTVLGNPEKDLHMLPEDSPYLTVVRDALELGRPKEGETQEDAGFMQSEKIMDLFDLNND